MPQPTTEAEDFSAIVRRARAALDLLIQLRVAPTPGRYMVAYVHQTGEMADLSLSMNRLVSHDKLTGQAMDEIYDQYFSTNLSDAQLRDASRQIERTVAEVADVIDTATDKAEHYGSVLAGFSDKAGTGAPLTEAVSDVLTETQRMTDTNRQLEAKLQASSREIEILRSHLEQAEREASLDGLTGIGNRKRFDSTLRQAITSAGQDSEALCLLMIDIDHFKKFNDTYGHQMGDQVLRLVARYMTDCIKGNDLAARYGGEEFGVILPRTKLEDAVRVGDQIRAHVASKKVVNRRSGQDLGQITLSIGAAQFRAGESSSSLVHRADEALYLAKATGRNRVVSESELQVKT